MARAARLDIFGICLPRPFHRPVPDKLAPFRFSSQITHFLDYFTPTMKLAGKTCLIVGASGAIGRTIAENFFREGAQVAVTSLSQKKGAFSAGLPAKNPRIAVFRLDLCKWKNVQSVVARVNRKFGGIHVLVNCAGILGPIGPTNDVSVEHWLKTIEINLVGSFYLVRAVLPSMLASGGGKIVQFSGGGAAYGRPFFTAYGASKAALVRFTESLAAELRDKNIEVNAIAPGPVKSRMWDELRASGSAGGPQAIEELAKMDLTGGAPAERAAALALFLASDRSNGLTGRLISAVHDKWEEIVPRIPKVMSTDAWTLRRVPLD
jgi:3-oxoacyl-[acyl-carrier protein] reductase